MTTLHHAETKSMRTLWFRALAARVRVERFMDLQLGSSSRSSEARDVRMAVAMPDFVWPRFAMMSASCKATTRFKAASSTSSWMPSSLRKSPRLLPRCRLCGLAVFDVGMFAFQGHCLVLVRCFLSFFNESVKQDDLFLMHKKERSGDACRQGAANFPQAVSETPYKRHAQRPAILKYLQVFTYHLTFIDRKLLEPFTNRLISARCTEKDDWQRTLGRHNSNCINYDTQCKGIFHFV